MYIKIGCIFVIISVASAIYSSLQIFHFLSQIELSFGACFLSKAIHQTYGEIYVATSASLGVSLAGGLAVVLSPHTDYVHSLRNWRLADLRKLLAIMVLTGGTVYAKKPSYKYCVRYYGKDITLHAIFCDLVSRIYGVPAKPAQWVMRGSYITQVYSKKVVNELLQLSPSYNTRNGNGNHNQTSDTPPHPVARFLLDANLDVIRESVRLASSSNGALYCTVERRSNDHKFFVRPRFVFGCLSPTPLLDDYKHIFRQLGLDVSPIFDRRYENKGFLLSNSWGTVNRFEEMGGFIEGVKINHGRYRGVERNSLLRGIAFFHRCEHNSFGTREEAVKAVQQYITSVEQDAVDIDTPCGYKLHEQTYHNIESIC